jgi:hypothetical protein
MMANAVHSLVGFVSTKTQLFAAFGVASVGWQM